MNENLTFLDDTEFLFQSLKLRFGNKKWNHSEVPKDRIEEILAASIPHRITFGVLTILGQSVRDLSQKQSLKLEKYRQQVFLVHSVLSYHRTQIVKALSKQNIPHLLLKGETTHKLWYQSDEPRLYQDIDLFVPKEALKATDHILRSYGFKPEIDLSRNPLHHVIMAEALTADRLAKEKLGRYAYSNGSCVIDLHWNPVYFIEGRPCYLNLEKFWRAQITPQHLSKLNLAVVFLHAADRSLPWLYQLQDIGMALGKMGPRAIEELLEEGFIEGKPKSLVTARIWARYFQAFFSSDANSQSISDQLLIKNFAHRDVPHLAPRNFWKRIEPFWLRFRRVPWTKQILYWSSFFPFSLWKTRLTQLRTILLGSPQKPL